MLIHQVHQSCPYQYSKLLIYCFFIKLLLLPANIFCYYLLLPTPSWYDLIVSYSTAVVNFPLVIHASYWPNFLMALTNTMNYNWHPWEGSISGSPGGQILVLRRPLRSHHPHFMRLLRPSSSILFHLPPSSSVFLHLPLPSSKLIHTLPSTSIRLNSSQPTTTYLHLYSPLSTSIHFYPPLSTLHRLLKYSLRLPYRQWP